MDKHIELLIELFAWYRYKMEKEGPVSYFWDHEYDRKNLIKHNIYNKLRYK